MVLLIITDEFQNEKDSREGGSQEQKVEDLWSGTGQQTDQDLRRLLMFKKIE